MLTGKHILLGVTGGIAAYKCGSLVREFVKAGADVQVVMTRSATQFITPLTLSTLSRRPVLLDMFPASPGQPTEQWTKHIELGRWADGMLVAPASANTIAKIAHGLADNFLTTLVLALRCPLGLAPSMDVDMYRNIVTQQNIATLKGRGCSVLDPDVGELASGLTGPGRLPEVERLVRFVEEIVGNRPRDLGGKRVLVTAGPTHESIDPVRYIGNRSSGKMGFAIAAAAAGRGAEVTLVAGPVSLETPANVRRINVSTAREMQAAVEAEFPSTDALIMAAAVADFSPVRPSLSKIKRGKRGNERLILELENNPDILKAVGARRTRQVLIGFALETDDGEQHAKEKLAAKGLDVVVLNNPNEQGAGFGSDTNAVTFITAGGTPEKLPLMSKSDVAHRILDRVVPLLR